MNPIKFKYRYDFGHEVYVQVVNIKRWSLFQFSVSWNDCPSWPYVQVTSGGNGLLSILFWAYKFGFDIDVLSRTWNWDYRENVDLDYLKMDEC
jgi:hypothetical protein